ncbi:hypothetical protein ACJ41O_008133 [Fusarium nematophilum]
MRVHTIALVSVAALAQSVVGVAVRRDLFNRHAPGHFPLLNNTAIATAPDGSTTRLLVASTTELDTRGTSFSIISDFTTEAVATTSTTKYSTVSSDDRAETFSNARPAHALSQFPADNSITSSTYHSLAETHSEPLDAAPDSLTLDSDDAFPSSAASGEELQAHASPAGNEDSTRASANRVRPDGAPDYLLTTTVLNNTRTCDSGNRKCGWIPSITSTWNGTRTPGTITVGPSTSSEPCTPLQEGETVTEFSIVYTTTVTFYGNRTEYTPPYPTISTPNYCGTGSGSPSLTVTPIASGIVGTEAPVPAPDFSTIEFGMSTKQPAEACPASASCIAEEAPGWHPTKTNKHKVPPGETFSSPRATVTFVTTDKNPAVVFPSETAPRFNQPTEGSGEFVSIKRKPKPSSGPQNDEEPSRGHKSAEPQAQNDEEPSQGRKGGEPRPQNDDEPSESRKSGEPRPQNDDEPSESRKSGEPRPQNEPQNDEEPSRGHKSAEPQAQNDEEPSQGRKTARPRPQNLDQPPRTFEVTARGQEVVVNDKTFSDLKPDQTSTVTVDEGTFTIHPTEVIGEGATVKKPRPVGTVVSAVTPTSTTVGGVPVIVSGSEAVIDGTKFKLPLIGTTTRLNEHPVSIEPGKIVVDDETLTFRANGSPQTDVIIEGGEMATAVGKSIYVFRSTTLTYGPGIPETSEVVDDDTITIAPSGVIIHGKTLGGFDAATTDTRFQIVGGATITKVSPSFVIIDGTTFTAGPGAKVTTKIIGGETITIGPKGIVISSITVTYPFGSSTVTTIHASRTATLPVETGTSNKNTKHKEDDDSGASAGRPGLSMGVTGFCIAIGVWIWI